MSGGASGDGTRSEGAGGEGEPDDGGDDGFGLLLEGYGRFRATEWERHRRRFQRLAEQGQRPRTMVVACSDSRVDPQMIFDAGPGELFVVRNVANLVPLYAPDGRDHGTGAALEFGVRGLGVSSLVVLGHGLCGGVKALLDGTPGHLGDFVLPWIRIASPVRARVLRCTPAEAQLEAEHAVVQLSLDNLRSYPWIAEREAAGRLRLRGAHFDVRHGVLNLLGADGSFRPAG